MKKFLSVFALLVCLGGCTSDKPVVVDEAGMTPEQQAEQKAYVEEMDGPPPS
ncbi:hypothetical protein [Allorhodopirellula heiligendammensis]|uniref:Uncharacterized protein n=1 Tax=Allorhodopirellula heiligendammensis TaxID=2714739 RepID=A0A5C6BFC1_9BACT|nr:hypothetical protein [Allorhodopirellula heiligendammensis]TWU10600.1 hypothetical protein Poly21_45060 [Allorhodopirellula heiligendammensis]